VTAYDAAQWTDLFVATAGASAALAGLVFVAVSINIQRILEFPGLPERALETILLLMAVLLVSVVGLIPGQGHVALGLELLAVTLAIGATVFRLPARRTDLQDEEPIWIWSRWGVRLAATVPLVAAGATVLAESGGGLYWLVAGIVFAIAGAISNAWVLLVEILR
jgi:modulator of FtsH protease